MTSISVEVIMSSLRANVDVKGAKLTVVGETAGLKAAATLVSSPVEEFAGSAEEGYKSVVFCEGGGRISSCAHGEHMLSVFFLPAHFLCDVRRHALQVKLNAVIFGVSQW